MPFRQPRHYRMSRIRNNTMRNKGTLLGSVILSPVVPLIFLTEHRTLRPMAFTFRHSSFRVPMGPALPH